MTATIDGAGRVVIPKALRERAGLSPGTPVDFRFHDGNIEISVVDVDGQWETRGEVSFPIAPDDAGELSIGQIRDAIEDGRQERSEQASSAGS